MNIFDRVEEAKHNFTHVSGPCAGVSMYWCEGCGAVLLISGQEEVEFQAPVNSESQLDQCPNPTELAPLKTKLTERMEQDYARIMSR